MLLTYIKKYSVTNYNNVKQKSEKKLPHHFLPRKKEEKRKKKTKNDSNEVKCI